MYSAVCNNQSIQFPYRCVKATDNDDVSFVYTCYYCVCGCVLVDFGMVELVVVEMVDCM